MTDKLALAVCFSAMLAATSAHAHHARAAVFTAEIIEIEGYVTDPTP